MASNVVLTVRYTSRMSSTRENVIRRMVKISIIKVMILPAIKRGKAQDDFRVSRKNAVRHTR